MRSRRPLLALLLALPLLNGCSGGRGGAQEEAVQAPRAYRRGDQGRKIYFDMEDAKGDDRGPGRYEYPTSFQGRFGFLDITRFTVEDSGDFLTLVVEFRRPIPRYRNDGSTEAKGYFLQLVDVYVDTDGRPGSGNAWALPGRNVSFDASGGWEKVVVLTPGNSRNLELLLRDRTSDLRLVNARHDVVLPNRVYPQAYSLKAVIRKSDLGGEPQPHWGWQVMAMQYEPGNLARNQLQQGRVQRFPDDAHFGGGTDFEGDPNVIDLLAPTADEQYRWLSAYRASPYAERNRFAVVPLQRAGAIEAPIGPALSASASGPAAGPSPDRGGAASPAPSAGPGGSAAPLTAPGGPAPRPAAPSFDSGAPAASAGVSRDPDASAPAGLAGWDLDEPRSSGSPEFSFEFETGAKD